MSIFLDNVDKKPSILLEAPDDPTGEDTTGEDTTPDEGPADKGELDSGETPGTEREKDTVDEFGGDEGGTDEFSGEGDTSTNTGGGMEGGIGGEENQVEENAERKNALIEKFEELMALTDELILTGEKIFELTLSKREIKYNQFLIETLKNYKNNLNDVLSRKIGDLDYSAALSLFITIRTGCVLIGKLFEEISEKNPD